MSFKKQVFAGSHTFDFRFIKAYTPGAIKYYVKFMDTHFQSHLFYMEQKEGLWKIMKTPRVPTWVYGIEAQLHQAIPD